MNKERVIKRCGRYRGRRGLRIRKERLNDEERSKRVQKKCRWKRGGEDDDENDEREYKREE